MSTYKVTGRMLLVVLTIILLASISFYIAGAEEEPQEPIVGPSATSYSESVELSAEESSSLTTETVVSEGGVDVSLGGTNEPAIAVNPLDSLNIAAASLFSLRVSTDNGVTFTAATPATVPGATHGLCGDPSLAFDSQGRLFWTYLGCTATGIDIFIAQVNPTTGAILAGYPVNVTAGVGLPGTSGFSHDKEWLAADNNPGSASPFTDRLHLIWTEFTATGTIVRTTFSTDQGQNWSATVTLSGAGEGFVWPSHIAVAPNGDVYATYHSQPAFSGGAPNGTSGQVFVLRSTDGGVTFPQKTTAYTAGNADITYNVQTAARTLNQSASWTQGSAQPWVLPDPTNQNNVYVIANDDPTNTNHGAGFDDMSVFIARSTDQGVTWSAPAQVNAGPVGTTQFFPTAAIDERSQCLSVTWYDTRLGATNTAGNFLLDLFHRHSCDGGLTFGAETQINDVAFDPDLGAPARFPGPPPTLRIGEYNGVAIANGIVSHAVWTGNTAAGQQMMYDNLTVQGAVDVYFLVDLSGSFFDDLPNFKAQAPDIISTLLASNSNTRFGLGSYEDYPINPFGISSAGDVAYRRDIDLTFNSIAVQAVIAGLSTRDGADLPQSQLPALYQAATGAGQDLSGVGYPGASIPPNQQANFRNGATKLFLLWTDASFHQPGDPGNIPYPGPSFADTVAAILALDPPQVIGITSGGGGEADLEDIAIATGAIAPAGGVDCDNDGTVDIAEGGPLVCSIASSGAGIGEAVIAIVEAAIPNQPPVANPNGPYNGFEGSGIAIDGTGSFDPDVNPLTYSWSVDSPLCTFDDATNPSPNLTCIDNGVFTVTLVVDDGNGGTDSDTAGMTVANVAPPVSIGNVSPALVAVGESVTADGSFTDPGTNDTHTAVWDWGDGTSAGTVSGLNVGPDSHTYTTPDIYTVKLTVTDDDGGEGMDAFEFVVVYDPSAGFVTGGGWIDSPENAYKPDPLLTGKATFGFLSRYKKGKTTPDGNAEFQFHAADLNFHSSSYEWLVVTGGDYGRFKGEGTVNGVEGYKFMLWAGDGIGVDGADTFRIRIWTEDEVTGDETDYYDNGMNQDIAGGSIVVHTKEK